MKNVTVYIFTSLLLFILSSALPAAQEYEIFYKQGVEAFKAKNYNSAELLFRKAIESDDDETRDRAWYFLARSIFEQNNYDSALYEFNSFLNKCKTSEVCFKSRFWMGETFYRQNKFNKAISEYKRFISNSKESDLIAISHDRMAAIYYRQKRYDEAVIEWEKSITSCSDKNKNARRVYRIAESLFNNNKYEAALKRIKPLLTSRAEKKVIARARILSGRIYLIQGNARNALIILNGIPSYLLKTSPIYDAQYFKALCYLKLNNRRAARSLFELFIIIGKDSKWYHDARFELGMIYFAMKNRERSLAILTSVIEQAPKQEVKAKAAAVVGKLYVTDNPKKAIMYLEQALPSAQRDEKKNILFILGKAYLKVKNYEKAGEIFNRILSEYPFHREIDEVKFYIARVYLEKKEIDAALAMFKKIQEENPFSPYIKESNFYLGILHFERKEFRKSEKLLKKYLASGRVENPYEAYLHLLSIYISQENLVSAKRTANILITRYRTRKGNIERIDNYIKLLRKKRKKSDYYTRYLLKNFPGSAPSLRIYVKRGDAFFKKGDYRQAIKNYSLYLANKGTREAGRVFFQRINALYQLHKYSEIISLMKKGNFPPMTEGQWQQIPYILARCHYSLGKHEQVYNTLYNKAAEQFPEDVLSIWVKSSFEMGDRQSAIKAMELLVNNRERYAEALYYAGEYHLKKAEHDEALGLFARILAETPNTRYVDYANLSFAKIYFSRNRFKEAAAKLAGIKFPPLKSEKTAYLIMCLFNLKKTKEAVALTVKNTGILQKSPHGEMVFKANMQYYFNTGSLSGFKRSAYFLGQYKGNRNYINYQYARLYIIKKNYRSAYYYFYKVTQSENDLYADALYNLAMINLFVYKNKRNAEKGLVKLIKNTTPTEYLYKAQLNLAIIYHEWGRNDEAKKILLKMVKSPNRRIYRIIAQNLMFQFFPEEKLPR